VLAGHSFGGLYVLRFASMFPDQVAGLVLLDSTAPKPGPAVPTGSGSDRGIDRAFVLLSTVAHFGVGRLIAQVSYDTLPPQDQRAARANASTAQHLASFWEEFLQANTAMQQASSLTSLDGKPLIVVTADLGQNDDQWFAKQDRLARLSTNSVHRHAEATHGSLLDDAGDSVAASQAIVDLSDAVRTGRPLR
jgi:pimeloyl-ACP methyl ester carboxylesterase